MLSIAASAAYALGLFSEARDYLDRALRIRPDSSSLRSALERVKRRLGE